MRVAITGTPGTGKTTATELLDSETVIHLNDVIREQDLYTETDADRDSLVADFDAIGEWLSEQTTNTTTTTSVVESHLAHQFETDRVVVLRCQPEALQERLQERGEPEAKAIENAEAEALDVILAETVDRHGEEHTYEIDTTNMEPEAVAHEIKRVISGEREPSAGEVNFVDYL